jgi:hypothetical protein
VASVHWRRRAESTLTRTGRNWTLTTLAHVVPFTVCAVLMGAFAPVTIPVAVILLVHAWAISELYAARGANVVRPKRNAEAAPQHRALLLLGDLMHRGAHDLHERTGLVLERGRFGVWLVGEAGALLIRPGGRRANCYCVKATDGALPSGDMIAHLLLALRTDESGFATVANLAFSGACWRLRRRLPARSRPALEAAVAMAGAAAR